MNRWTAEGVRDAAPRGPRAVTRAAVGILSFAAAATVAGTVLGLAAGRVTHALAALALAAGVAVAALALRGLEGADVDERPPAGPLEVSLLVAFALVSLRTFLWVVYPMGNEWRALNPNNLGDLPLHWGYIATIASGAPFWPDNPELAGSPLRYPLGMDLLNALLVAVGADLGRSLVWVGLAASLATGVALARWGGGFAVAGFLWNGGIAGFVALQGQYVVDFQDKVAWKCIPLALFSTQRGLLFAVPAGLLLLDAWRHRFVERGPGRPPLLPWVEVLLYATMPLFHVHSFLFLSLVLAFWFVTFPEARRPLLARVGAAFLPATALVLLVVGPPGGRSLVHWKLGWLQEEGQGAGTFWFQNFGVWVLAYAALVARLCRLKGRALADTALAVPGLVVFAACSCVAFAPWEWDNTKLLLWGHLVLLPPLFRRVLLLLPPFGRTLACVGLFGSGVFSVIGGLRESQRGVAIGQRSEVDGVARALATVPLDTVFASAPTYDHPLLMAGRRQVLGYPARVWSHGLDAVDRETKLRAFMQGEHDWRALARDLGIGCVYWGHREATAWPTSSRPWEAEGELVASGPWGCVYRIPP